MRVKKNVTLRTLLHSRLTALGLVLVLLCVGWVLVGEYTRYRQFVRESRQLEERISETEKKNNELSNLLSIVSSPEYLERVGKSKLNLKREGESVYVINAKDSEESGVDMQDSIQESSGGWFDFLGF